MTTSGAAIPGESGAALYERLWELGAAPPDLFAFLRSMPGLSTPERADVVRIDQRNRWRIGLPLSLKLYLRELPDIAVQADLVRVLIDGDRRGRLGAAGADGLTRNLGALENEPRGGGRPHGDETTIVEETGDDATSPRVDDGATNPFSVAFSASNDLTIAADRDGSLSSSGSFALDDLHESAAEAETLRRKLQARKLTLVRKLGAGGMGVVFEAYDEGRGEIVALKTMRRADPQALVRFKQEFRSLADIAHVNLVSLFEMFAVDDSWFITMELVEGTDFLAYVRDGIRDGESPAPAEGGAGSYRAPRFHEGRLRQTLVQVASGVHHLHDCGKLHRDIKPNNVLVTEEGRVVVLDFGLAADLKALQSQNPEDRQIVGTAAHMSPEQAAGREASAASDWYSVGVMLYQALTGRVPFDGTVESIMSAKQIHDPPPLDLRGAAFPADLALLCRELLDRDPRARPTGPMILERLRGRIPAVVKRPSRIVGRSRHRRILDAAYDAMKAGKVGTVFLYGKSGAGKTTLLHAFVEEAASKREAVVLEGRCFERESVPFKALDSLIDALARYLKGLTMEELKSILPPDAAHLARLFPVLRGVEGIERERTEAPDPPDPQEGRLRAFTGLRELLKRMGARRPLVLAIDDLQWGDVDSAVLLADLLYSPDPPVLLLVASFRMDDGDDGGRLLQLLCQCRSRVGAEVEHRDLAVEPLGLGEAREMALALLGRDDSRALALAHMVARESAGNPMFIDELVNHLEGSGEASPTASADSESVDLDAVILARIQAQSDDAGGLLDLVAVAGRPIPEGLAFTASGLGASGRLALAALRSARLLRGKCMDAGDEIEVYHDRIRRAVLEHMRAERQRACHKALARAYEALETVDPETLAAHLRGAGETDRAGAFYAVAAANAADALAFDHAARLYRAAAELGSEDPAVHRRLQARLGDALANAGRGAEAAEAYRDAARTAASTERLALERAAAGQLLISGHLEAGVALLRTILKPLGLSMPSNRWTAALSLALRRAALRVRGVRIRARTACEAPAELLAKVDVCWTAAAGLSAMDPLASANFQARGLLLALRAGEPDRIARALAMEAVHVAAAGRGTSGRVSRLIAEAHAMAESADSPHARGVVLMARGVSSLLMGEWRAAAPWFQQAETEFRDRCSGVAWELDTVHILSLWALYNVGEIAEVHQRAAVLGREARDRGDLYVASALSNFFQATARIANDDPGPLDQPADAAVGGWPLRGFSIQDVAAVRSLVLLDLYQGKVDSARTRIESAWPEYARSALPRIQMIRIQMNELRARVALAVAEESSAPEPFLRLVEGCIRRLDREPTCWAEGHVHFLRAGLAACRKDAALTLHELGEAARSYAKHDMVLQECVMRLRSTEIHGGEQGRGQAEPILDRMKALGVASPALWTQMAAPGFARVVSGKIETSF